MAKPKATEKAWTEPRISRKKIAELALAAFRGQIFTSEQIRNADGDLLAAIFVPLRFLSMKEQEKMRQHPPALLYGYTKDAAPRSINGYPIFFHMGMLYEQDAKLLKEKFAALVAAAKEVLKL